MFKKILCVLIIVVSTFMLTIVPCFAYPSYGQSGENYVYTDIPYSLYFDSDVSNPFFIPSVNLAQGGGYLGDVNIGGYHIEKYYPDISSQYQLQLIDSSRYHDYVEYGMSYSISAAELDLFPSSPYLLIDEGAYIAVKLEDIDYYSLNLNYISFAFLLPKGIDVETVSANCRVEFNSWYKAVSVDGGVGTVDYSSETVNSTIGTSGFGQPYIQLTSGTSSDFDISATLFDDIYNGANEFQLVTVKIFPFALLQEYTHYFNVGGTRIEGIVATDFKLTPSLTVGGQDPIYYDWLESIHDPYLRSELELIGDEIINNGRNYCLGFGFHDSSAFDNEYLYVNADNYLNLMGGFINFQKVTLDDFNLVSWLGNTLGGVLDVPLMHGVSLGTVLYVCVGVGLSLIILKFFVGG